MRRSEQIYRGALASLFSIAVAGPLVAQTNNVAPAAAPGISPVVAPVPHVKKIRANDADNHSILLNRPNMITVILGTSEESQDAARAAGKVMYPLQGRPDFQLVVVVDLRNSMATWVPSVVLDKMRSNLDDQALELKPYFLQNGNKSNPRLTSYVVPDFTGTVCPLLGWTNSSDDLRGILYGIDGKEIMRWDKIADMMKFQGDVRGAIQALIDADKAKAAAAAKTQGTKLMQPLSVHPPLLPPAPMPTPDE